MAAVEWSGPKGWLQEFLMASMKSVIAVLLAGGQGERLVAVDARSCQAGGTVRRRLPNH